MHYSDKLKALGESALLSKFCQTSLEVVIEIFKPQYNNQCWLLSPTRSYLVEGDKERGQRQCKTNMVIIHHTSCFAIS